MKKFILYTTFAAFGLMGITTGCSDFGDTNLDPEHPSEANMNYKMLFTGAQVQALGSDWDVWRNGCIYSSTMMQHTTSVSWSQVFYTYSEGYNAAFWDALYSGDRGVIRDIIDVLRNWEDLEGYENDYQLARIMKSYMFHRMTDLYGDIPYSEAGQMKEGKAYPKYDTQKEVYTGILEELNDAQSKIDVSAGYQLGDADLYFSGKDSLKLEKWKKFANSLILRAGMRLSKVDPAEAEKWVKIAVNNGIIDSQDDNVILYRRDANVTNDSAEPYGKIFTQEDQQAFFLSEFFVNLLKNTSDPRLALIGIVTSNPGAKYTQLGYDRGNPDPAVQVGMPIGYNRAGGEFDIEYAPGFPRDLENFRTYYSMPNRYTYADPQAPTMVVTYAENQLLLAEAAYRGWLSGTSETKTAKEYYENGVRAAMKQFSFYPNASFIYSQYITDSAIDNYLNLKVNLFDNSRALEMINTQYYITTFCDEYETFANWRRSGYPVLKPVDKNYPGAATNGTIPRRFTYPSSESQSNATNYNEAVSRLKDGNTMTSRVWWDVE